MLKKAGIVVATSAAALLAVSPLAFAGDYSSDNDHHHSSDHHHHSRSGCDQDTTARSNDRGRRDDGGFSIIDISRNAVQVPIQACNNNILNNIGVGVLGRGRANGGNNGGRH